MVGGAQWSDRPKPPAEASLFLMRPSGYRSGRGDPAVRALSRGSCWSTAGTSTRGPSQTCLNERNIAANSASTTGFSPHSNTRVVLLTMGGVQPSGTGIAFSTAFRDPRRRPSSSLLSAAANASPHSPRACDVLHQRPAPPRLPATPGRPSERLRLRLYISRGNDCRCRLFKPFYQRLISFA